MSKDTFDPVTAIASRQPALNPARHYEATGPFHVICKCDACKELATMQAAQVSPAVLEFRLLQMTQERNQLMMALQSVLPLCVQGNSRYEDACELLKRIESR